MPRPLPHPFGRSSGRTARIVAATSVAAIAGVGAAFAGTASAAGGSRRLAHDHAHHAGASGSSGTGATALQDAYVAVVDKVRGSVVQITTPAGLGSGVVYDNKGDIVTNDHVVGSAKTVTVQFVSGTTAPARVVGTFAPDDLAVVKVEHVNKRVLHPATFATMSNVAVGDIVLAIGNPLAFAGSVTNGIVSALGRTVVEPVGGSSPGGVIANAVQTSAPINPGNSGGALVDLAGKVVGIPTLAAEDPQIGGQAIGIGFAIPASTVSNIAGQIVKSGRVTNSHRADLGIYSYQALGPTGRAIGVGVARLLNGSPAKKAGLAAGDVITAIDKHRIETTSALERILAGLAPGKKVTVHFTTPSGASKVASVTLGTLPASA